MWLDMVETSQVYVPVGLPDITFVRRENLEGSVKAWEMNKAKHLLIFGPSKSGKTSLWKKYVPTESVIKIPCNSNKSIIDVYSEILSELNSFYTVEKQTELGLKSSFLAELTSLLGLFSAKVQTQVEVNNRSSDKQGPVTSPNIGVNLIIKYLKPSRKIIVLEDFHYANDDLKHQLSQDLKAFSDDECPWIIVGIQHKTSKLLSYNIDLQQRIAEIPVEGFTDEQLINIIELGESALNIKFSTEVKNNIIDESIGSASLVQNICQRICILKNITRTSIDQVNINNPEVVYTACKDIAYENKHYYEDVIKNIAIGGRNDGSTEKYKWFLKLIRDVDIPEHGLRNTEVLNYLKELGHKGIKQGSVTSGLGYLPRLLQKLKFPSFFDYDAKTFYLLDKYIKFVFKWIPGMIDDLFEESEMISTEEKKTYNKSLKNIENDITDLPDEIEEATEEENSLKVIEKPKLNISTFNEFEINQKNKVIEINQQDAKAWNDKGVTFDTMGRYSDALAAYDKVIGINPQFAKAWYNKGVTLRKLGKYEDALAAYDKAIGINPQFAEAWYNKGVTLRKLGKYEDAKTAFENAHKLDPKLAVLPSS
jgi:tetratricopeptide (TPR) repeat protein